MLRIGCESDSQSTTIKLDGKLAGPWVDELERAWYDVSAAQAAPSVVVDLSGVNYIDAEGKKLLGWMFRQGAELRNGPLMTRYVVEQIKQGADSSQGNGG